MLDVRLAFVLGHASNCGQYLDHLDARMKEHDHEPMYREYPASLTHR